MNKFPPALPMNREDERRLREMNDALLVSSARQHELTEQAQTAEAALRESEQRFRELVEQVKDYAIFRVDLEGRAVTWNEGVEHVLGFAEDEFLGHDIAGRIFTPEDIAAGVPREELETAAQAGVASDDRWMRRKSGERFFALGATTAIKDKAGRVTGFSKVMRDHTRLKEAQDALRQSEEQFRRAIEDAPIPVIMHAEDGEVLQISKTWTDLTGYRIEDLRTFDAWLGEAYGYGADAVRERVKDLFQGTSGLFQLDFEILTRSGEKRVWAFSASSPGALGDGRRYVVGMALDITERKRAEETQQLLLGELNHRVKNTLATIQAIAQQTLRSTRSPEQFAASFGGRLRALARVHTLLTNATWQGADLRELIRDQVLLGPIDETRLTAWGPSIKLEPQMALHMALVLHELATNSFKYGALSGPNGWVTVSWTVQNRELRLQWLERGGPPADKSAARGFGTTMVEESMKAHQGSAKMIHEAQGVSWSIVLPLLSEATGPAEQPSFQRGIESVPAAAGEKAEEARPSVAGKRILVVEDEPLVALDIVSILQEAGIDAVGPANTAEAALRLIEKESFDAALVDANLKGRPVGDLAAALTERGVPFAFVTGYARASLPEDFRGAALVTKPFSPASLLDAAARLLAQGQSRP